VIWGAPPRGVAFVIANQYQCEHLSAPNRCQKTHSELKPQCASNAGVENICGPIGKALAAGILILAWVAFWRLVETIEFDPWESREERRLLAKLSHVAVRFEAILSATV
jgi:hypothetical protein